MIFFYYNDNLFFNLRLLKTFAIETSCDDTCISLVEYENWNFRVLKSLSYSQIQDHQEYGWVVPEIASRLHNEKIVNLLTEFWLDDIKSSDFISYTAYPGLPGSLLVWATTANILSNFLNKEIVKVNHIYWHIFSLLLDRNIEDLKLPMLVLTASGWHNEIYLVSIDANKKFDIQNIWKTIDDAAWEAFDKVSKMLWWPYPGGAWISEMAKKWKKRFDISSTFLKKDEFNFSFSWTKSKVYYKIKEIEKEKWSLDPQDIYDIAYAFQEWVVEVLSKKLLKASLYYNTDSVAIVWWVSANDRLFEYIKELFERKNNITILKPTNKSYCTDNANMIWVVWILDKNYMI